MDRSRVPNARGHVPDAKQATPSAAGPGSDVEGNPPDRPAAARRFLGLDRALTRSAASWKGLWASKVLPAVEESAEHTKLWLAAAAFLAVAGGRRGRRTAGSGLAGMWTGQAIGGAAKYLWDRRRPPKHLIPNDQVEDRPDSSSFPSGHTAAAVAFTTSVAAVWPVAGVPCAALTAAIALERIHSGAHYPSDVVVGAVIGFTGARLARHTTRLLNPRLGRISSGCAAT
ncbi:phosphatase PAP2 family protein [Streptomyces sp. ISL-94]|uniref:phosphatase PAP2 family protein n=1 Tax=Streptomyces sp. ISL-94 TaxID=2819190 RepID=UPI001BE599D1|nr:phosphatase PAP2 family protein [Streptomyces sp. ISL-94]MBT2479755.1 phosphatase PAP2 family protein [Streptomyces sp. ISL-94]